MGCITSYREIFALGESAAADIDAVYFRIIRVDFFQVFQDFFRLLSLGGGF